MSTRIKAWRTFDTDRKHITAYRHTYDGRLNHEKVALIECALSESLQYAANSDYPIYEWEGFDCNGRPLMVIWVQAPNRLNVYELTSLDQFRVGERVVSDLERDRLAWDGVGRTGVVNGFTAMSRNVRVRMDRFGDIREFPPDFISHQP